MNKDLLRFIGFDLINYADSKCTYGYLKKAILVLLERKEKERNWIENIYKVFYERNEIINLHHCYLIIFLIEKIQLVLLLPKLSLLKNRNM